MRFVGLLQINNNSFQYKFCKQHNIIPVIYPSLRQVACYKKNRKNPKALERESGLRNLSLKLLRYPGEADSHRSKVGIRQSAVRLFEFFGNAADHLKGYVSLVAVLVFFIGINQGKVTGLQGGLLPFFVDQGARAFNHIVHVHYNHQFRMQASSCINFLITNQSAFRGGPTIFIS